MGLSRDLVGALRTRLATAGPAQYARAGWLVADSVAIALAATRRSPAALRAAEAMARGSRGDCAVWGLGGSAAPAVAAFGNAAFAHALDLDDTSDSARLHPTTVVLPAAFAAAELVGASGRDLLDGYLAGVEAMIRLGRAAVATTDRSYLWFLTQLMGYFGAAVAAGVAMGLDDRELEAAIDLAYSQVAGGKEASAGVGGDARTIYPGYAAQGGLQAALLAASGVLGPPTSLEGRTGLWPSYLDAPLPEALAAELLGESEWAVDDIAVKIWPSCRITHRYIDAVLALPEIPVAEIQRIEVSVDAEAAALCTPLERRRHPDTVPDAAFSVPFMTAVALARRRVDLSMMDERVLADREILGLVERVAPQPVEERGEWPRLATVTVTTASGTQNAVGGQDLRPTEAQGRAKIDDVLAASGFPEGLAERLWELGQGLADAQARDFLPALHEAAGLALLGEV